MKMFEKRKYIAIFFLMIGIIAYGWLSLELSYLNNKIKNYDLEKEELLKSQNLQEMELKKYITENKIMFKENSNIVLRIEIVEEFENFPQKNILSFISQMKNKDDVIKLNYILKTHIVESSKFGFNLSLIVLNIVLLFILIEITDLFIISILYKKMKANNISKLKNIDFKIFFIKLKTINKNNLFSSKTLIYISTAFGIFTFLIVPMFYMIGYIRLITLFFSILYILKEIKENVNFYIKTNKYWLRIFKRYINKNITYKMRDETYESVELKEEFEQLVIYFFEQDMYFIKENINDFNLILDGIFLLEANYKDINQEKTIKHSENLMSLVCNLMNKVNRNRNKKMSININKKNTIENHKIKDIEKKFELFEANVNEVIKK